ncbi:ABC transporter permease [Leptospira sp. GIMC2001]|uniref:ABC transporter permease n=1 Tax=Leptospira sp. GIMC2001 TaxID=1513297 RepID=UPI0023493FE1|nr:MlaE family lipid ABC transporter permease subunit [Leptospira sp. GIMC2001]WCL48247.1 MlaE family lipid ABC transporter permease subunit [Leptospira sp. GIMC2001]
MDLLSQTIQMNGTTCEINIAGVLNHSTIHEIWDSSIKWVHNEKPNRVLIDVQNVHTCDAAGIAFILEHKHRQEDLGLDFVLRGLKEDFRYLYEISTSTQLGKKEKSKNFFHDLIMDKPEEIGEFVFNRYSDFQSRMSFIGEFTVSFFQAMVSPKTIRWKDLFRTAENAGVNAFPIIALIGFLLGLIMSFQSAIPMQKFGAEIFVANLVGLSLFRELGPLMTAFILAGRTGSAFAAELGTMKVSEEIDALSTMGLSPIRFLVLPRILATTLVSPLLTLIFNLLGLCGGALVLYSFGFPLVTFINQIVSAVRLTDLFGGIIKSIVFGATVASVGCYEGLRTTNGAGAVGSATTRAVVSGIIYVAILDGVFSIAYFYLGI